MSQKLASELAVGDRLRRKVHDLNRPSRTVVFPVELVRATTYRDRPAIHVKSGSRIFTLRPDDILEVE